MSWKTPADRRSSRPRATDDPTFRAPRPRSATLSLDGRRALEAVELDRALLPGARNVVDVHLRVTSRDRVAILCDVGQEPLARAILESITELGASASAHVLDDGDAELFASRVDSTVSTSDAVVYVFKDVPHEGSLRARMLVSGHGSRQVLLAGVSSAVALQSLRANPDEITRLSEKVAARIAGAQKIEVVTTVGTNVSFRPSSHVPVRIENGAVGAAVPRLPAGEVLCSVAALEGDLVADGGVWFDGKTHFGVALRVVLSFADGRLAAVRGVDSERLVAHLEGSGIPPVVSAVGFGTNPTILTPVRELAQDTRMPGFHLMLGRPHDLDDLTAPLVHVLVRRPDVRCDGAPLLVNGRYARDLGA